MVFISIAVISLFSEINWINLKPETTSVLLNYNNFWQLNANLDYFTRHIDSLFMHLWYISILIQFDIFFPIIFILLRKIVDKISKTIPISILLILSILGIVYFCYLYTNSGMRSVYYNTFSRVFSLILGVTLGFIHSYYKSITLFFSKSI